MGKHKAPPRHNNREDFERIILAMEAALNQDAQRGTTRARLTTIVRGEQRDVTVHLPDAAVYSHIETQPRRQTIRSWRNPRPVPESIQIALEHLLGDR